MIMNSTSLTIGWNRLEEMAMARDSGVVMRMCGGFEHPLPFTLRRITCSQSDSDLLRSIGRYRDLISSKGPMRLRWMSFARALMGEMYMHMTRSWSVPSKDARTKRSMTVKNAVNVLPDPVGLQRRR